MRSTSKRTPPASPRSGRFLTTLPAAPVVVIKEPKMTALSGMWFEAARLAGFHVATVIAVRHPHEATASLVKTG